MVAGDRLLAFVGVAFALIVVPGPSVLFVISRGVALGRRAAVTTVVGNAAGVYVQVVAVALGVGALVERSAMVFRTLSLAGARCSWASPSSPTARGASPPGRPGPGWPGRLGAWPRWAAPAAW